MNGTHNDPPRASLLFGRVMHRRLRPVAHRFVYPVYFCALPLADAAGRDCGSGPAALGGARSWLFSHNRFNLFSFHDADHGARDGSPLLPWLRARLAGAGIAADGAVWLQCFPRVLGFVFNPVSFWFCHDRDGALRAILAEVNNTFGERHNYLLARADGQALGEDEWLECRKVFHVSPFMAIAGQYRFRFRAGPGAHGDVAWRQSVVNLADAGGELLQTALYGRAEPLTGRALLRAFLRYPWLTLGVVLRIHWQALLLWRKHVPFFRKPEPPLEETTR